MPSDLTPEQRAEIVRILSAGEDLSPEWARIIFPPEKREYELVYARLSERQIERFLRRKSRIRKNAKARLVRIARVWGMVEGDEARFVRVVQGAPSVRL